MVDSAEWIRASRVQCSAFFVSVFLLLTKKKIPSLFNFVCKSCSFSPAPVFHSLQPWRLGGSGGHQEQGFKTFSKYWSLERYDKDWQDWERAACHTILRFSSLPPRFSLGKEQVYYKNKMKSWKCMSHL